VFKRVVKQPDDGVTLICTACKERKVYAEFSPAKAGSMNAKTYGFIMPCKVCNRARKKGKRPSAEAAERIKARRATPEYRAKSAAYQRSKHATPEGKAKLRTSNAKNWHRHHEKLVASQRAYSARHDVKARAAEWGREYRSRPEIKPRILAAKRADKKTNRGRLRDRLNAHLRRDRISRVTADLTPAQWIAVVEAHDSKCVYCQSDDRKLTIDHVKPIARGGAHTLLNVAPACHSCNVRKNATELGEALDRLGVDPLDFIFRRNVALLNLSRAQHVVM